MDQRILDRLETLESGARVERPARAGHVFRSGEPGLHKTADPFRSEQANYTPRAAAVVPSDPEENFWPLDDFDQQLLRQPVLNTRYAQPVRGQAESFLQPALPAVQSRDMQHGRLAPQGDDEYSVPRPFDTPATSSLFPSHMLSSPTSSVSQRRSPARESRAVGLQPSAPHSRRYDRHQVADQKLIRDGRDMPPSPLRSVRQPQRTVGPARQSPNVTQMQLDTPNVGGNSLVAVRSLPDRFRAIFPFTLFTAVQSKCFETIYHTNDNFVLSAPTGSGKTAVMELAICRLVNGCNNGSFKIVYQAPTKSLCSERQRDWQQKFAALDLQCAELTGDTEAAQLRNVQHASIIITTPEKWDSMTRKWKDHQKLMQMVKLFLIDEVHILKEDRGATLEAIVSRMKSVSSDVRFVALSATVPNSQDIAVWLGKDPINVHLPATEEKFGEEFRPVRLQKHVCGYQAAPNDFAFDKVLNKKLPEVIAKWSQRKPLIVFCFTRSACIETAGLLAEWWGTKDLRDRYWSAPQKTIVVLDHDLRGTVSSGVAFHHAGLSIEDRAAVERGYLAGDINVICCTSTLAVGVNLPCHMVIIKNTVTYHASATAGCKEYSDLEIMQMLGRAGRPQFDNSAVAVIMTRLQRVPHYEKMITGQEILESCLHRNLIDHLNAEIGLGTITSVWAAKRWLTGTFLYVRLKNHPEHYKIDGDAPGRSLDERLETICSRGVQMLSEHDLVMASPKLRCTEFGDAMARYYIRFDTMKVLLALPRRAKVSEILSTISQASEFKEIRFRAGEKNTYRDLNKNSSIKFPIPVGLDAPAHKVSLVMQAVLGGVELQTEDQKQRFEFNTAKAIIFQHTPRLVRCLIDCQLSLEDAVATRNALMLARSLGAQVWDDSPLHMKQLETVGLVTVRRLVAAGIKSIDELEDTEALRIEHILGRNPPYGTQLQEKARAFPRLRVSIKLIGEPLVKKGDHASIKLRVDVGFLNEKTPEVFQKRPIYVCMLAETSEGKMVHFARISAKKLKMGQELLFNAKLTSPSQSIRVYAMCEDLAGTVRHATLKLDIPLSAFPTPKAAGDTNEQNSSSTKASNASKRRTSINTARDTTRTEGDEIGDEDIDDAALAGAEIDTFADIDELHLTDEATREPKGRKRKIRHEEKPAEIWEPKQLDNGRWACNHACKDKSTCKHLCCREGLDKRPNPPKAKTRPHDSEAVNERGQTQLNIATVKKPNSNPTAAISGQKASHLARPSVGSKQAPEFARLHSRTTINTPHIPTLGGSRIDPKNGTSAGNIQPRALNFSKPASATHSAESSDHGSTFDLPGLDALVGTQSVPRQTASRVDLDDIDSDAEMLDTTTMVNTVSQPRQLTVSEDDLFVGMAPSAKEGDVRRGNTKDSPDELDVYFGAHVQTMGEHTKSYPGDHLSDGRQSFVEGSSDSHTNDPGRSDEDRDRRPTNQNDTGHASSFPPPKKRHKGAPRDLSIEQQRETTELGRATANIPAAAVADTANLGQSVGGSERGSLDEAEQWLHEYLGSELFSYT